MPLEITVTFRCRDCRAGYEFPAIHTPSPPTMPSGLQVTIQKFPHGWHRDGEGGMHCPEHPPTIIVPAGAALPNLGGNHGK